MYLKNNKTLNGSPEHFGICDISYLTFKPTTIIYECKKCLIINNCIT